MLVINQELYAVIEIDTKRIKFMVFSYHKSQFNVLFNHMQNGNFCENGVVLEPKIVGKLINMMVKKANLQLAIQIKRVALNLVSNGLTIRQGQAIIEINRKQHRITNEDISNLIAMSKNISLANDEVICLTRPYKFIVNGQKKLPYPPIYELATSVAVNSLVYTIKKEVYNSHLEAINYSKLELLSLVLMPFCHAWATVSRKELQDGAIIIDWNYDNTQVSIFAKETLYDLNIIDYGFKNLIADLQYALQCPWDVAEDYLHKIINIDNNFLDNKIIYSKYDYEKKKYLEYSHQTLKNIIISRVEAVLIKITEHLAHILKARNLPIVFLGEVMKIAGFVNYINKNSNLASLRFYNSNVIGANDEIWSGLIGNAYYQHLLNKNTIEKVFSIDRISREPQYPNIPKNHKLDYVHKY